MGCPRLDELPPPPPGKTGWPWTVEGSQLPDTMPDPSIGSGQAAPWPKITIVTPSYNQGKFFEETIRSVLLQGYPNLEYIIIDGGSTDNSVEIIQKYDPWLAYWVSEPDRGQSHAINKGFARATGDILAWLNSDDRYLPGCFLTVFEYQALLPDAQVFCGAARRVDAEGRVDFERDPPGLTLSEMLKWCNRYLPQSSCFFRRESWERCGPLDEGLSFQMDYDLWLRMAKSGLEFVRVPSVLSAYTRHAAAKTFAEGFTPEHLAERLVVLWRHGGEAVVRPEILKLLWQYEPAKAMIRLAARNPVGQILRPVWQWFKRRSCGAASVSGAARILIVSDEAKPRAGGAAELLHNVAKGLVENHEVTLLTSHPRYLLDDGGLPYSMVRFTHPRRKEGERLGNGFALTRKFNTLLHRLILSASEYRALAFAVGYNPDVILLGCLSDWAVHVSAGIIGRGRPSCIFVHGMDICVGWSISNRNRRRNLRVLRRVTRVLANSTYTAKAAERLGVMRESITVIPLCVDISYWDDLRASPSFLNQWNPRLKDKKVILSIGRLIERKGFDMVISTMPLILERVPEALYVICGSGPDEWRLKQMVKTQGLQQHVLFTGPVSDDDKKAFLDACYVFTMPCRKLPSGDFEGFGIVFLEAGVCRKPVVGGNTGGVPDAIVHEETGFLVDPTSSQAIASALTQLLLDDDLRKRMGEAGRQRVEKEFDLHILGERLSSILEELLNPR